MKRTHYAGLLRADDAGGEVTLCGWVAHRRDHGGVVFIDLRDVEGLAQVVLDPERPGCELAHRLRSEYVVAVRGAVRERPEGTVNAELPSGAVEVDAHEVVILNEAEPPPFPLDERADVDEALRLRYRYLDLRRPRMARNLRVRARLVSAIRSAMERRRFVDIETPSLTRSTPEGARDFLVPSRLQRGTFYALPQSPQLFKQLLMVGGLDRYYQVARCWRDEDLRADRQLEFTQLDLEASFVGPAELMEVVEDAVNSGVEAVTGTRPGPYARLTWAEAMERFGSDKPDLRIATELVACTEVFANTAFRAFEGRHVVGLRAAGRGDVARSVLDSWTDRARALGAAGLVWMRVREGGALESTVVKFLDDAEQARLVEVLGAAAGDLVLLVADEDLRLAQRVQGALRLDVVAVPEDSERAFAWVTDFPLFEGQDAAGRLEPAHHPFTMPHADDIGRLSTDPLSVRSLAYDLVLDGVELGSGSVRIHDRSLQEQIFGLLGIDREEAGERFGFLLEAFRHGAPPHAGFAFGLDRLAMLLTGEDSLREVIAFPKTQSGGDPLTGAPASVAAPQLRDLGIAPATRLPSDAPRGSAPGR